MTIPGAAPARTPTPHQVVPGLDRPPLCTPKDLVMTDLSFDNLLWVCLIGALVPITLGFAPRLRLPSVVVEIGVSVLLGRAVLDLIHIDAPVAVLSWLGLAFLLFLAGLEVDTRQLDGRLIRRSAMGYMLTLALATPFAVALAAVGWINEPALLVIALSATHWAWWSRYSKTPARWAPPPDRASSWPAPSPTLPRSSCCRCSSAPGPTSPPDSPSWPLSPRSSPSSPEPSSASAAGNACAAS
jgi:hypothetical protein